MKLSENYQVQQLVKERSDLSSHLYAVTNTDADSSAGFQIAFNGTFTGGEARGRAAAILVPFYQGLIEEIDHKLRDLGVDVDL